MSSLSILRLFCLQAERVCSTLSRVRILHLPCVHLNLLIISDRLFSSPSKPDSLIHAKPQNAIHQKTFIAKFDDLLAAVGILAYMESSSSGLTMKMFIKIKDLSFASGYSEMPMSRPPPSAQFFSNLRQRPETYLSSRNGI
ncbi:hypothetical protein L208DRAFT_466380 [Tricholoma matsutake]|nr:hypothetical protein L208DRAFT_466380 [Tricholoma matsutake 945]